MEKIIVQGRLGETSYGCHPITTTPTLGAGRLTANNGPLANDEITYAYDELGRLEKETNALGTFTYAYEEVTSLLSLVSYPNGQTTSYSYYGNAEDRRLLQIHHHIRDSRETDSLRRQR